MPPPGLVLATTGSTSASSPVAVLKYDGTGATSRQALALSSHSIMQHARCVVMANPGAKEMLGLGSFPTLCFV